MTKWAACYIALPMSEKYESGISYYESQQKQEWQREFKGSQWTTSELSFETQKEMYSPGPSSVALEAAVKAFQNKLNWGIEPPMAVIPFVRRRFVSNLAVQNNNNTTSVSREDQSLIMEKVLLAGDLAKMDPKDRIDYYLATCRSLGMNPMTRPFDLITLNGKMVLYPNRSGADQLRKVGNVDVQVTSKCFDKETGCYTVTAQAKLPSGRTDEDMGVVYCLGKKGDDMANAQLKAMTKAKRRVTLSIMGLGWVDESEVGSIKGAKLHKMDLDTGGIIDVDRPKEPELPPATKNENISEIEKQQLRDLAKAAGIKTNIGLNELVVELFRHSLSDLTENELPGLREHLIVMASTQDDMRMVK